MLPPLSPFATVADSGRQVVDNVVRWGRVSDPNEHDHNIEGVRTLLKHIQGDKEVDATTLATVGEKGFDGLLYAIKL